MNTLEQLKEKVAQVQVAMLAAHPTLPILLAEIHKTLKADPAQVTLLEEDEIGILVSGLEAQTKVEIMTTMTTGNKSGKALKKLSMDDI
jgi:hypothetical protein